jgi:dienelactone hydrolase
MVWGNGGCLAVGTIMAPFLLQVASQGIVVIANGDPEDPKKGGTYASYGTYGKSTSKFLTDAIDWAEKNTGSPKWQHIDTSRIAAAGQSCGGTEVYGAAKDKRIKTLGIFNSGAFNGKSTAVKNFTQPIFYFLGGPSDIAYKNVS